MPAGTPPGWFPDPFGRYEARYWDGWQWTPHVTTRGAPAMDPPFPGPPPTGGGGPAPPYPPLQQSPRPEPRVNRRVARQVANSGVPSVGRGGGSLFNEPLLVVNQKPKLIEVSAEYAIYNDLGHQIGAVREVGRSAMRSALSPRPSGSEKKRFHVLDAQGQVVLDLVRPEKLARSSVIVRHPDGTEVGRIAQKTVLRTVRFDLLVGGERIGKLKADRWGVLDFAVEDGSGAEVARITKNGTSRYQQRRKSTKRDKYVVEIVPSTEGALRVLLVAAAVAIDTALRQ